MALTLHNISGAEYGIVASVTGEVSGISGTVAYDATIPRSGTYCFLLTPGATKPEIRLQIVETGNTALAGNDLAAMFAIRFADVTPGTAYVFFALRPTGGSNAFALQLNTDGTISILDAGGSVVATSVGIPFAVDTWYMCKVYATEDNSAGAVELFVDTASVVAVSSVDTAAATAIDELAISGAGTGDGTVYADDIAIWSGATDPSDVPDNIYVLGHTHSGSGVTEVGDALTSGSWAATADNNEGTFASYDNGPESGHFHCDGDGADSGPSGHAGIGVGDEIEGAKYFARAKRATGTPDHNLLYGNNVDGVSSFSIATILTVERFAKIIPASDPLCPTLNQFASIGGSAGTANDLDIASLWVFVLFSRAPTGLIGHPGMAGGMHDLTGGMPG